MKLARSVLVTVALAMVGVVSGHAFGYWLAGGEHHGPAGHHHDAVAVSHRHLIPLTSGAFVLLVVAAAVVAVGACRRSCSYRPNFAAVATVQLLAYCTLEVLERVVQGVPLSHLVTDRCVAVALLVQLPVALLLVRAASHAVRALEVFVQAPAAPSWPAGQALLEGLAPVSSPPASPHLSVCSLRGPPVVSVT